MIGVFTAAQPSSNSVASCLGRSFAALGNTVKWRNPGGWGGRDQFERQFSTVIVHGLRGRCQDIADAYREFGRRVIVVDLGFLKRSDRANDDGYFSVGYDLHWMPPGPCAPGRFNKLNIALAPHIEKSDQAAVIIIGQVPFDRSHGLNIREYDFWVHATYQRLLKLTGRPILYRKHPFSEYVPDDIELQIGSLDDALRDAHAVVTFSSNVGNDALIAGVPVFTCGKRAQYISLANRSLSQIEKPFFPTDQERRDYFARLAYAQWTRPEINDGLAARFMMRFWHDKKDNRIRSAVR